MVPGILDGLRWLGLDRYREAAARGRIAVSATRPPWR